MKTLQTEFQGYLTTFTVEGFADDSSEGIPKLGKTELYNKIMEGKLLSAKACLQIYYDAYRLRLLEILESDFPKLSQLMKHPSHLAFSNNILFNTMSLDYIRNFPSQHFSVRYFGAQLSAFLKNDPRYQIFSYLSEMAEFEWAIRYTLDAKNAERVSMELLKQIPIERFGDLQLKFHPSLLYKTFYWNIPSIWTLLEQHQNSDTSPEFQLKNGEPVSWFVFREHLECAFRSCNQMEMNLFQQFESGQNFAEACEALLPALSETEIPTFVLSCLQQWLRDGIISEIILQNA